MPMKIKELPELERPYEKLELYGEKALSNAELLAIIIKTGTKEETSVQLAQKLLKLNNTTEEDLGYLQTLTIEELMQIKGIGKVKAIQLKAVGEIAKRTFQKTNYKKTKIKYPKDIAQMLMSEMRFKTTEVIKVIILNSKNEILKIEEIASGGSNFANAEIKEILSEPVKMKAPKIILVHNHPSGDPTPSLKDKEFTQNLYEIAMFLGIELVDHVVIGNMNYKSIFTEMINEGQQKNDNKKRKENENV